jgi:hypothetical protein
MARRECRPTPSREVTLVPQMTACLECGQGLWAGLVGRACGQGLWVAYHRHRTVVTLAGLCRLTLVIRRCSNRQCPHYHRDHRACSPEEEGRWALPHGAPPWRSPMALPHGAPPWRVRPRAHRPHRPHRRLALCRAAQCAGDPSAPLGAWRRDGRADRHTCGPPLLVHRYWSTATGPPLLVHRYEELVALRLADQERLRERLATQGHVVLAIDGLQPDVGCSPMSGAARCRA